MTAPACLTAGAFGSANLSLIDAITAAGVTANLKLALDAGDADSYSSGQNWLDRSGGGYDFFRGADATATTNDPTFNGAAGLLSDNEYWSCDGGDFFRYDAANETWMNNLHKDGAQFTILAAVYLNSTRGTTGSICGDRSFSGAENGFAVFAQTTGKITLDVQGAGSPVLNKISDDGLALDAWHLVAITIEENGGASAGFLWADGEYLPVGAADTWNPNYSSPSTSNASATLEVAGGGAANLPMLNGDRMAAIAMWEGGAIGKSTLDTLFGMLRGRFGI